MRHLRRRFLILDIRNELLDARMATSTNNSIGAVPKANFPEILAQVLGKFFPDVSGTHCLQITNEPGQGHGRMRVNEQVNVVCLTSEFDEFASP